VRLRELKKRALELRDQLATLPTKELRRIEDLDQRARTLEDKRTDFARSIELIAARAEEHENAPHTHLRALQEKTTKQLADTIAQRTDLARDLGDPTEARAEREHIEHALSRLAREQRTLRRTLERELDLGIGR